MPKINVYLPDDLAEAVKQTGVSVSAVCQRALEQAVQRVNAIQKALRDVDSDGHDLAGRIPNLTPRAVEALGLGIEQARSEDAAEVGTGHLVGGMLAEGSNLALRVLEAMDIDPEQVRRALDAQSGDPAAAAEAESEGAASPRFSPAAAAALELAVTEAISLGHNYVGCEHFLLGLVNEPDGGGGQVLRSLGVEAKPTRRAVTAALTGFAHLKAVQASAPPVDVGAAVRQELRPVIERLDRLEHHVGLDA